MIGEEDGYDVVVVGSGYGGSVAACRLSMAGLKVCLVEKGRRWEAHDFPTDHLKMLSACRFQNKNLGVSFGPNDALFQIYEEKDSVAAMACGLGGGSLVNAGVITPTTVRARRNLKWPKEWERDWEVNEASASVMLRAQSVPAKFPNARIMEDVIGDEFQESTNGPLKLSINFDAEKQPSQMDACLACGNCLSGCPYNAKNSTDKNYIHTAIQEGCVIKTECQVQYVVENPDNRKRRRWLVYFNEIDYVECDFVVLSAGVFGTTNILFQSQMRGLKLSDMLGSGISCNGNNVAYLAGSAAPLSASGLDRKHFSKVPFQERPGPAISSSYTNSLGFTIQSAVLPAPYVDILFKGITTYGWPPGYGILYGLADKLKFILGLKNSQGMILNVMGYDENDGKITFEKDTSRISFQPPQDTLLPRKIKAFQKLSKKLGGILYMSKYRSTSVHLLGGCNASKDPSLGVCNTNGQVFDTNSHATVHAGLYVCDASLIPCSVGINPCLTIAAASEHVSKHLVQDVLEYKNLNGERKEDSTLHQTLDSAGTKTSNGSRSSSIIFTETMRGHVGGMPVTAYLKIKMNSNTSKDYDRTSMNIKKVHPFLRGRVGGYIVCTTIEKDKLHVIDGEVDMCEVNIRSPYTQCMHYRLLLAASSGSRYILEGKKVMNPFLLGLYMLRESTELHATIRKLNINNTEDQELLNLQGSLHISMFELLRTLISMRGNIKVKFVSLLLQSFIRTYILQIPRGVDKGFAPSEVYERNYPSCNLLEIKTEDGFMITCKQWKGSRNPLVVEGKTKLLPVLLINGYATESYWLPSEPNDMVRTLLGQGYETWLLQPRVHHSNSSNSFSIEDIGKYDIPAVFKKIHELNANSGKVHVVAHCAGGLAIHIAIMGGHVSSSQIASLSCTNSSMFFKLAALASFKMWLPLLPITMLILGKDKTLPMIGTLKTTFPQRFLRSIARLIPRYERCTCDECEIFSGIFGNAFWHDNITSSMHDWLNKKSLPVLPMAGFPHLRKICNSGFIVDSNGQNTYLIHPERMSLPTLYISGGKTILVTPETSFLANKYMKLHQPEYRHDRVVVDGFGHSDLFIGEESYKKVFPHILSHIELAEKEFLSSAPNRKEGRYSNKQALDWAEDPYEKAIGGFDSWIYTLIYVLLFLLLLLILIISSLNSTVLYMIYL
ncbi:uncharacterized protein LOC141711868 [Apium graveolens]|uniref:uncharacterized protein LOC141711868 n=1 Tax=Apium graveolens TaxID=4045 RepID=UPI003D7C0EA1